MKVLARSSLIAALVATVCFALIACSSPEPTSTPVPPTATPVPPTSTPLPPTPTPIPPTATPVPPTATPAPPTATPEPASAPESAVAADKMASGTVSEEDAACIQQNADPDKTGEILEALGTINSGDEVQGEHILDLLDAADALVACELLPAQVVPLLSQITREDASCVIEHSGTEQLVSIFATGAGEGAQTFNIMSLAPLLGALQACDVSLNLTAGQ